jgi:hypothetical protein
MVCILTAGMLPNLLDESIRYFRDFFWWFGSHFGDAPAYNAMTP